MLQKARQMLNMTNRAQPRRSAGTMATLSEAFAVTGADAAAAGFVLAHLAQARGPVLWLQDRLTRKEAGAPYLPGLGAARDILMMTLTRPVDVLTAAEDGLRCKALGAVVVEVWGDPSVLDFTVTKRLALRCEAGGVPCWLIRHAASPDLSAARDRWRVTSLASALNRDDPMAPGQPRWQVELFRSRDRQPGSWVASHDGPANRLDLVAAVSDGTLVQGDGAAGRRPAG